MVAQRGGTLARVTPALKGLVLSGGAGTRLRPITHTSAKQLVPVANRPILFYGLDALAEAGVRDVGIVVGDTQAEIEAAVGDGSAHGLRVTYIRQSAPLGLAHAVLTAEEYLDGSPFVMYLGDNLLRDGITELVDGFRAGTCDAMILLQRVADPQSYGVAELEDGRVVRLAEKPAQPRSDLALVGVYMFTSAIMDSARAIRPSGRGELEITDAIQHLIDRGLTVEPHEVTRLVEGHRAPGGHARGQPADPRRARAAAGGGADRQHGRGPGRRQRRGAPGALLRARAGDHRRGGADRGRLRGALLGDLPRGGGAAGRGGAQHPAGRRAASRTSTPGWRAA